MQVAPPMLVLLLLLSYSSSKQSRSTYEQFLSSTPKTFGLHLIVSFDPAKSSNDGFLELEQSVTYYASFQCPLLVEIVVVVKKDIQIQNADFKNSEALWEKKVYFLESEQANFYISHPQSKSELYFMMNSDAIISCDQLTKSYNVWVKSSVGDISPIVTYNPASYNIKLVTEQITFDLLNKQNALTNTVSQYFSIALLNGAWVPRFYLELFSTQNIQLIKNVRDLARKNNNCFDIAFNFVVYKYFPELVSVALGGDFKFGKQYFREEKLYTTVRSQCLKSMMLLFGHNPLRFVNKADIWSTNRFDNQILPFLTFIRRKELESIMLGEPAGTGSGFAEPSAEQNILREELSKLKQQIKAIRQKIITINEQQKKLSAKHSSSSTLSESSPVPGPLSQMDPSSTSPSTSAPRPSSTGPDLESLKNTAQNLQSQKNAITYILYSVISVLTLMVIGVISYGCALCCSCTESIEQEEEEEKIRKPKISKSKTNKAKAPSSGFNHRKGQMIATSEDEEEQ